METTELRQEFEALVDFARGSKVPTGFGYMDEDGATTPSRPVELWITGRMTHIFALATMYGIEGAREYMDHGVHSLIQYFHDPIYGGWYSSIQSEPNAEDQAIPVNDRKEAYAQAFVILAASSAVAAGNEDAAALLQQALAEQLEHWYDPATGLVAESWNRDFTTAEDYRGINANMHTVEASLAAADVLDDEELLERATRVLKFVSDLAAKNDGRIPEHFDTDWNAIPDYNRDQPAHPFRPYGVTPGHALEWARLMLHARGSRQLAGLPVEAWMLDTAEDLINGAVADGWDVDGSPGFVYTTDFDGTPVVHERMHWVLCEAIGAATVFAQALTAEGNTKDAAALERQIEEWWEYAQEHLIVTPGRWTHELDRANNKSTVTWAGKPDVYHAAQTVLLPLLPVAPTFGAALRDGHLKNE